MKKQNRKRKSKKYYKTFAEALRVSRIKGDRIYYDKEFGTYYIMGLKKNET